MSKYYRSRQVRLKDPLQVRNASDLNSGDEIAVFDVLTGNERFERVVRTALAFAGVIGSQEGGRVGAAKDAWRFQNPEGLLPLYHGNVNWVNLDGGYASIAILGLTDQRGKRNSNELIELGIEGLVAPLEPIDYIASFDDMGLRSTSVGAIYGPNPLRERSGTWEPHVTLRVHPRVG